MEEVSLPLGNNGEGPFPNDNAGRDSDHCPLSRIKGFSIASLNVNSLLDKIDEVRLLAKNKCIDICTVSETKIDDKVDYQLIAIDDFSLIGNDRNRQGGGVALYVRNTVGSRLRQGFPNKSLEIICVEVETPHSNPVIDIAWYRPPSEPNSCFDSLQENLSFFDTEGKKSIILGDTNCDFNHANNSPRYVVQIRDLYDVFGMAPLIKKSTRVTLDSSTLIDHIATTNCNRIVESGVLEINLSDHYVAYCIRKLHGGVKRQHRYITSRQLKNCHQDASLSDLSEVDWEEIVANAHDVDDAVRQWAHIFALIVEKHAPTLSRRVSDRYTPWLNADYFKLAKTRDKFKSKLEKAAQSC